MTRWPQIQPVTAPNAPVSAETRNSAIAGQAPGGLDGQRADAVPRARLGVGSSVGRGRRARCVRARRADRVAVARRRADGRARRRAGRRAGVEVPVSADGLEQAAERAVGASASRPRGPVLDDPAALEDRDLLGALDGREPVGDEEAGAPGEQPVGGRAPPGPR